MKALGAAAASSGSVALFHAVGVTPEAPDLATALGGSEPSRRFRLDVGQIGAARAALSTSAGPVGAVSVGTPHMSVDELTTLAHLTQGQTTRIPFFVNTSRAALEMADSTGIADSLREFGATLVTDTCTYVTPIMGEVEGAVMTNSGKWAFYAPANLGVEVVFSSLRDCVEIAATGRMVQESW